MFAYLDVDVYVYGYGYGYGSGYGSGYCRGCGYSYGCTRTNAYKKCLRLVDVSAYADVDVDVYVANKEIFMFMKTCWCM